MQPRGGAGGVQAAAGSGRRGRARACRRVSQGYFERYPDAKTLYGVPGAHHDQLPDNSFEALKAWHAKEDAWLADAKQIDPAAIAAAPLRATYAITREALEGSIGARVCRYELWTVS